MGAEVYLASTQDQCQFDLNSAPISQLRCTGLPQANRVTGLINTYAGARHDMTKEHDTTNMC
jgi:hypothetical protein